MKKIFYLFLIGIMFVIPKNVFASYETINYKLINLTSGIDLSSPLDNLIVYPTSNNGIYTIFTPSKAFFASYVTYRTNDLDFVTENSVYDITITFFVQFITTYVPDDPFNIFTLGYIETSQSNFGCSVVSQVYHQPRDYDRKISLSCPSVSITKSDPWFRLVIDMSGSGNWNSYGIYNSVNFVKKDEYVNGLNGIKEEQEKTNEKLDETNKNLDEINDTMNDSNVNMDGANSFFGDFSDTDHGGISGVVTAPLRFINKLTGTCSPISLNVLGANVELPCGDTLFWNKPEVTSFKVIWNVLLGGPILYLLLSKLFKVIEGLKNPDDSRIEVMKL